MPLLGSPVPVPMHRLHTLLIGPDEHITIETRMTNLRDIITIAQNESFETIT
jgi:hypothetical protein